MTVSDTDAVARIGLDAWKSNRTHPTWFREDVEARVENAFVTFANGPDAEVLVAIGDDAVVGWGARDNRDYPGDRSRGWDYISDLWIAPSWQGMGIGTAILLELLHRIGSESLNVATIETDASNGNALCLYERLGFAEVWRGTGFSPSLGLDQSKVRLEKPLS